MNYCGNFEKIKTLLTEDEAKVFELVETSEKTGENEIMIVAGEKDEDSDHHVCSKYRDLSNDTLMKLAKMVYGVTLQKSPDDKHLYYDGTELTNVEFNEQELILKLEYDSLETKDDYRDKCKYETYKYLDKHGYGVAIIDDGVYLISADEEEKYHYDVVCYPIVMFDTDTGETSNGIEFEKVIHIPMVKKYKDTGFYIDTCSDD